MSDTQDLPLGRGTGSSPLATGEAAFELPPVEPVEVRTSPEFSRRAVHANAAELGFGIDSGAGLEQTPTAAVEPNHHEP